MSRVISTLLLSIWGWTALFAHAGAPKAAELAVSEKYMQLLDSGSPSLLRLSPDEKWLIIGVENQYQKQKVRDVQNYFPLVGKKFDTQKPVEAKTPYYFKLHLVSLSDKSQSTIEIPNAAFVDITWSPDSKKIALIVEQKKQLDLWRYDLATQSLSQWSKVNVSAQLSPRSLAWLPNSQDVVVRASLQNESKNTSGMDVENPSEALVRDTSAKTDGTRLYRDSLDSQSKQEAFSRLTQQRAVLIRASGEKHALSPAMSIEDLSVSPNGDYLLVKSIPKAQKAQKRFSKLARRYAVYSLINPNDRWEQSNAERAKPIFESQSHERNMRWLPTSNATLAWISSSLAEQKNSKPQQGEAVYSMALTQQGNRVKQFESDWKIYDFYSTAKGRLLSLDWRSSDKQLRVWDKSIKSANTESTLLMQYNYTDKFSAPGDVRTLYSPLGIEYATSSVKDDVYFFGTRASKSSAPITFVTQYAPGENTAIKKYEASGVHPYLWLAQTDQLLSAKADENGKFLLSLWHKNKPEESIFAWQAQHIDASVSMTSLRFARKDGVALTANLYSPQVAEGEKIPAIIWLYPQTYRDSSSMAGIANAKTVPVDPRGPFIFLEQKVAVIDFTGEMIHGKTDEDSYDSFSEQQTMNAEALVAELKKQAHIDTDNLMIMGHSFGAFSVANLLANTNLFKAGIARSGAFNRTLTPIGFQDEKRTLWQAKRTYLSLSPMLKAGEIKEPLLLIHGAEDENPGTAPLQSKLMFEALQSTSGTSRLVILPFEGHNYTGKDQLLTMYQHQRDWITKYLF